MDTVDLIALTLGASWASGINLYAAMLVLGWMGSTGQVDLPPGLEILANPMVMMAAGAMYFVEFFADKIPGVDTGWIPYKPLFAYLQAPCSQQAPLAAWISVKRESLQR